MYVYFLLMVLRAQVAIRADCWTLSEKASRTAQRLSYKAYNEMKRSFCIITSLIRLHLENHYRLNINYNSNNK